MTVDGQSLPAVSFSRVAVEAAAVAAMMVSGAWAPAHAVEIVNKYDKADWFETFIPSSEGVKLHVDVLRPKGLSDSDKTPVILSIGPYFSHLAQEGFLGPNGNYTLVSSPSTRFKDFTDGAQLFEKGYTYVMVDLRGYGGSSGCSDMLGPGEQADIKAAVEWAAAQPWSTGKVGMYGKSYDGETGVAASGLRPNGLAAVVAQEPVYDNYRYAFGNGVYRYNSIGTPAVYAEIALTPGVIGDSASYKKNALSDVLDPSCMIPGIIAQTDPNHDAEFWRARNLVAKAKGSTVPVFLTQGFIESNTVPDGMQEYLDNLEGPKRGWFGMWDHVRGADTDSSAGQKMTITPNALAMGREGWYDEVMRFYDKYLKGIEPTVQDPNFVIQTNDAKWRAQDAWPMDVTMVDVPLTPGTYAQHGFQTSTLFFGASGLYEFLGTYDLKKNNLWTYSEPAKEAYRISGTPEVTIHTTPGVTGNIAVNVYDMPESGLSVLVTRNVSRVDASGTTSFKLFATDWVIQPGHRYVVRVTDSSYGRWLYNPLEKGDITVESANLQLPTAPMDQGVPVDGDSNSYLRKWMIFSTYPVPAPK